MSRRLTSRCSSSAKFTEAVGQLAAHVVTLGHAAAILRLASMQADAQPEANTLWRHAKDIEGLGYASATCNRYSQLLGQAFNWAIQKKQLADRPYIKHLSEKGNVRRGFFEAAAFQALLENLPLDLQDFVHFGYLTGWRKGEIASLRWEDVEIDVIRLREEDSKNEEPRSVPIEGDLQDLIERRKVARRVEKDNTIMLSDLVFHRDGEPVGDFRKAWARACCLAGVGKMLCPDCGISVDADYKCEKCSRTWKYESLRYKGKIFHDLRRTAVRDLVRAGNTETVAMSISGHRTRSVFDRYDIADDRDQRKALRATQTYRQQRAENQNAARSIQ